MNVTVHQPSSCGIATGFPETLRSQWKKYNNASWRTSRKFLAQSFSRIQQHATEKATSEGRGGKEEGGIAFLFSRCPSLLVNSFLSHGKGKSWIVSYLMLYLLPRGLRKQTGRAEIANFAFIELHVCRLLLSSQCLKGKKPLQSTSLLNPAPKSEKLFRLSSLP